PSEHAVFVKLHNAVVDTIGDHIDPAQWIHRHSGGLVPETGVSGFRCQAGSPDLPHVMPLRVEMDNPAVVPIRDVQFAGAGHKHTCGSPQPIIPAVGLELIDDLDCAAVKVKTNNTIVASIRQIDHAGADG